MIALIAQTPGSTRTRIRKQLESKEAQTIADAVIANRGKRHNKDARDTAAAVRQWVSSDKPAKSEQ